MATNIGPKIGIDGEKQFRSELNSISQQLRTLGTEMKAVTSSFDANDSSQKKLAAQSDVLTRRLSLQKQQLAGIQKGLDYAKANYAENSDEVQRWQQALNNATTDMNKTKSAIRDLGSETDESGKKVSTFGEVLKANLTGEAIISGVKAVARAIKDLIGGAVEGFGEYEQLVGGVETLFKNASGTVQEYANNAYKTAGLSANEYMETVTSFSASLLQSMGNDTQAAAEKADRAITDMSDNANKMGTDMKSIQNAYQGFAKQNYTMLDNLKLGYGGTKTEMERLIADANALNAAQGNYTSYTIDSYADIVDAIHTVQTEMGITGTTALEASTTIDGSIGAVKSAWKNLITGLANDNADLDELVTNLLDSVTTAGDNIIPRIESTLSGISQVIAGASQTIIPMVISTITDMLPDLLAAGASLVSAIGAGIADNLPAIVSAAAGVIVQLSSGLAESLPELIPAVVDIILQIVETLLDNVDQLVDAAVAIITGLAEGIINALPVLIEKAPVIISKLVNALIKNSSKILQAAVSVIVTLAEGLIKNIPSLIAKIPQIITALVNGFLEWQSKISEIGTNIVHGIWEGIKSAAGWIKDKISDFVGGIVDGVKDVLGIHSPSRVFAGIGENMALGLGQGFASEMQSVGAGIQNAIPTPTVDTVYNAAAGMVNGLAAQSTGIGGAYTINLVLENGTKIATWLLDPLRDAARSNPEVATA